MQKQGGPSDFCLPWLDIELHHDKRKINAGRSPKKSRSKKHKGAAEMMAKASKRKYSIATEVNKNSSRWRSTSMTDQWLPVTKRLDPGSTLSVRSSTSTLLDGVTTYVTENIIFHLKAENTRLTANLKWLDERLTWTLENSMHSASLKQFLFPFFHEEKLSWKPSSRETAINS